MACDHYAQHLARLQSRLSAFLPRPFTERHPTHLFATHGTHPPALPPTLLGLASHVGDSTILLSSETDDPFIPFITHHRPRDILPSDTSTQPLEWRKVSDKPLSPELAQMLEGWSLSIGDRDGDSTEKPVWIWGEEKDDGEGSYWMYGLFSMITWT